jgi:putative DNA primase/helicase
MMNGNATSESVNGQADTLSCALSYVQAGMNVLPILDDGSKAPALSEWRSFEAQRVSEPLVRSWFRTPRLGVAILGGSISGNLGFIDIEYPDFGAAWAELIEAEDPGLVASLPHVATPGKGNEPGDHYYFRSGQAVKNRKLAQLTEEEALRRTGDRQKRTAIELKGEGGYVLAPGCPGACHPSGRLYRHVGGPFIEEVPLLSAEQVALLLDSAGALTQVPATKHERFVGSDAVRGRGRPGDLFNQKADWLEILSPHGWTVDHKSNGVLYLRRPGKSKGHSATLNFCKSELAGDLLCVFSSNASPLEIPDGESFALFSKFSAYALLNHDGDFSKAAKALWKLGYRSERVQNYFEVEVASKKKDQEPDLIKIGLPATAIHAKVLEYTGKWPQRIGSLLFAPGENHQPLYLEKSNAAFAWIGRIVSEGSNSHHVAWVKGQDKITQGQFFEHLSQTASEVAGVEAYPHEPALPGFCYLHPPLKGGDGLALAALEKRFCAASPLDGELIHALFLTLLWGGRPGSRPLLVVCAAKGAPNGGRGVGKTSVVELAAQLVGGWISFDKKFDLERLKTRLLSPGARNQRVALLDNLKGKSYSNQDLEGLITSPRISGHQMYVGEGQRPNTILWAITSNETTLSRDLAARCVVFRVGLPAYSARWKADTQDYIEEHRWSICGDIVEELRRTVPAIGPCTRWGEWEEGVLAHVPHPAACQGHILQGQKEIDSAQRLADLVREGIADLLTTQGHNPDSCLVWMPSHYLSTIVARVRGKPVRVDHMSRFIGQLGINELEPQRRPDRRGWLWTGPNSPAGAPCVDLP